MSAGGGKGERKTTLPPGFEGPVEQFGQTLSAFTGIPLGNTVGQGFNFFQNLPQTQAFQNVLPTLNQFATDPLGLETPFINRERERLGGELVERGRQFGLGSSDAARLTQEGLANFTADVANRGSDRALRAAGLIPAAAQTLGSSLFTPFQALSSPLVSAISQGRPAEFGNPKGGLLNTLGQIGGGLASNPGLFSRGGGGGGG